jgi:hypothetical protein
MTAERKFSRVRSVPRQKGRSNLREDSGHQRRRVDKAASHMRSVELEKNDRLLIYALRKISDGMDQASYSCVLDLGTPGRPGPLRCEFRYRSGLSLASKELLHT